MASFGVVDVRLRSRESGLILDLDGTLMDHKTDPSECRVPLETVHHLQTLQNAGVAILIATGRDSKQVDVCLQGQAARFDVMSSDGAKLITTKGHVAQCGVTEREISFLEARRAEFELLAYGVCQDVRVESKEFSLLAKRNHPQGEVTDRFNRQVALLDGFLRLSAEMAREQGLNLDYYRSGDSSIFIAPNAVNKATGFKAYSTFLPAQFRRSNYSNIVFIGDSFNPTGVGDGLTSGGNDYALANHIGYEGTNLWVANGKSCPVAANDPAYPKAVLQNPAHARDWIKQQTLSLAA